MTVIGVMQISAFTVWAVSSVIAVSSAYSWLRTRDPIPRQIMLIFTPATLLAVAQILGWWGIAAGATVAFIGVVLTFVRPYLTLRLAAQLRPVPRWLSLSTLAFIVVLLVPLMSHMPWSKPLLVTYVFGIVVVQTLAAALFWTGARGRTGSSAMRLRVASLATCSYVARSVLLLVGLATGLLASGTPYNYVMRGSGGVTILAVSDLFHLLSALGYVVAFLPPAVVRRMWSATAVHEVSQRILTAPPHEEPQQVWQRYADVVREVSSADAVVILRRADDGYLHQQAASGRPVIPPPPVPTTELTGWDVAKPGHPARGLTPGALLRQHYADQLPQYRLTVASVAAPHSAPIGALLTLNTHTSLFREDDLQLIADLGGQAAVLAERSAVLADQRTLTAQRELALAEQRRLAADLSASLLTVKATAEARNRFVAAMNHELRTPLNAIIGFSDLIRADTAADDVRHEWAAHIYTSAGRLLLMVNDLLDLAKADAGQLVLHTEPTRIDTLTNEILGGLGPLFDRKGLHLDSDLAEITVDIDPLRFRQVLENLLSNAIKFTPADGSVIVSATHTAGGATLSVADTGPGIAPADQPKVFAEFEQVGDLTAHPQGTGLGLALAKQMVEAHGGSLTLTSALGKGCVFTVFLPASRLVGVPPTPPLSEVGPGRSALAKDDTLSD